MRFYVDADAGFFTEYSDGWDLYCRWPHKSWARKNQYESNIVNYWRDLDGAKKQDIKMTDLYFDNWLRSRIREPACLPLYYAVGNRFIRITKAFPAGFKCAPVPLNLIEARAVKAQIKEEKKQAAKQAKLEKKQKKLAKAEAKGNKKK